MTRAAHGASWWRPVATVSVFAVLPFVAFLDENRSEAELDGTLVSYSLLLLLPGLAMITLAGAARGRLAAERTAVVFAAATFVFFKFELARAVLQHAGVQAPSQALAGALWAAAFVAAVLIAWRLSTRRLTWVYALLTGLLLTAVPAVRYTAFKVTDAHIATAAVEFPVVQRGGRAAGPRPDVYFFLLDAYTRADYLRGLLGYDNSPFLRKLRRRGFHVADRALSAYTVTSVSLASTFSMHYPLIRGQLTDRGPFFETIRGKNPVVRAFRRLGYDFALVHQSFGCKGYEDICVNPDQRRFGRRLGEREWALLGATPLSAVLPRLGVASSFGREGTPTPIEVVRDVERRRGGKPVFVFAHLLTTHPPYRFDRRCQLMEPRAGSTLEHFGDVGGPYAGEYTHSIACTNRELLRAIDAVTSRDPRAVVVLAGDHGSAFGLDLGDPPAEWTRASLRQRFAVLNAARLPGRCGDEARAGLQNAVNTFRVVLGCLTGRRLPLLPSRHFAVGYEQRSTVVPVRHADLSGAFGS